MPPYLLIPMLAGAILFGWVAGMWTRRRTERWCASCGSQLECGRCQHTGIHPWVAEGKQS